MSGRTWLYDQAPSPVHGAARQRSRRSLSAIYAPVPKRSWMPRSPSPATDIAAEELPLFATDPDDFKGLDGLITIVPVTRPKVPHDR